MIIKQYQPEMKVHFFQYLVLIELLLLIIIFLSGYISWVNGTDESDLPITKLNIKRRHYKQILETPRRSKRLKTNAINLFGKGTDYKGTT